MSDDKLSDCTSIASDSVVSDSPADGEFGLLLESLDEPSPPLPEHMSQTLERSLSFALNSLYDDSVYGHPIAPEELEKRIPSGKGGLTWNATIIPDEYFENGRLKKGLDKRDFDSESHAIKPRRPTLPVTASNFFSSLVPIDTPEGRRFIFYGVLNGWPALRCLELVALEQQRSGSFPTPKEIVTGQLMWTTIWTAENHGKNGIDPKLPNSRLHRAKLRGSSWTGKGWSKESPGFAFWFESQIRSEPQLLYGTDMMRSLHDGESKCTHIHMLSHRYAKVKESPRDKLTYHSIALLEWDHGMYTTVVEAAYLNGMGGFRGRTNWYDDRDEGVTKLYEYMPAEMVLPWRTTSAEIRAYDVPHKTLEEFQKYVAKYQGPHGRFMDPRFTFSHKARLTFRTKAQIAQYLVNYIGRDSSYGELKRNCQTFTADLCSFLAGKKDVVPFHPVSRIEYNNRTYLFLYDHDMYESKEEKASKKRGKD